MDAAEKTIWDQHQARLSIISRQKAELNEALEERVATYKAGLQNQPDIMKREVNKAQADVAKQMAKLNEMENTEIALYKSQIETYDKIKQEAKSQREEEIRLYKDKFKANSKERER